MDEILEKEACVLTPAQYLELLLGPPGASAFPSDAARHLAWIEHRPRLLALVDPGSRPWAWWQYDAPQPPLPREPDADYLARCGLLSATQFQAAANPDAHHGSQATRKP